MESLDNWYLNQWQMLLIFMTGCSKHLGIYNDIYTMYQQDVYQHRLRPLWPLHTVPPVAMPVSMSFNTDISESAMNPAIIENNAMCKTSGHRVPLSARMWVIGPYLMLMFLSILVFRSWIRLVVRFRRTLCLDTDKHRTWSSFQIGAVVGGNHALHAWY